MLDPKLCRAKAGAVCSKNCAGCCFNYEEIQRRFREGHFETCMETRFGKAIAVRSLVFPKYKEEVKE